VSRDPRAPVSIDSDIRTYTIRDPRANSSNTAATPPQIPSQTVQPPARPQIAQQLPKPGSSTDTEKVIIILITITKMLRSIKYLNQFMLYFRLL